METLEPEPKLQEGKESIFSKASRPKKYIASATIYYCTFGLGVCATFLGPTLVDFSNKFNTTVAHVSTVFTILLVSYLVGALLNGILNHFIDRQKIVLVLFCVGSGALYTVPHISSINGFFSVAVFLGLFAGGYDSAQVAWIIDIWRHEAPPFILTQHFFYSLGTVVPPLLLAPFLKGKDASGQHANNANRTENEANNTTTWDSPLLHGISKTEQIEIIREGSDLWIPFTVAGSILLIGFFVQLAFYFSFSSWTEKIQKHTAVPTSAIGIGRESESKSNNNKFEFPALRKIILIALSCCFIAFYTGLEWVTMQFLATFTHFSSIALTESEGANVLSGLTMAFCVCRGFGIFIVLKVPAHFILFGNLILMTAANLILAFLADESVTWMWVGSVLLGMGMSTTCPAYFAYIEKYLFITDTVAAVILVCAGGVASTYPIIVGNSVKLNPTVMIYVNFFSLSFLLMSFSITLWLTFCRNKNTRRCRVD